MVTGLHQICKSREKLTGYWNKVRVNSNVHRDQNNYERGQAGISLSSLYIKGGKKNADRKNLYDFRRSKKC